MAIVPLKIIVEQNVPFLEPLEEVAEVIRLPYKDISAATVSDADALIVRTRNKCDSSLLEESKVQFIGTATIGTDHIDLPWCESKGICVANSPGSNAPAVAQYVFSSLVRIVNRPLSSYRIGIVGVGHVGSIVERWAKEMSMPIMLCDPPRQNAEGGDHWHTLGEIAEWADIITFHTPLTESTYHLADESFFNSLRRAPIIINSARGPVINNKIWVEAIESGVAGPAVVDCWEGEPDINKKLLKHAAVATPHIAGYSIEGKQRASQMVLDALCGYFDINPLKITGKEPKPCAMTITPAEAFNSYDPTIDTVELKASPGLFETLRNNYKLRNEPDNRVNK